MATLAERAFLFTDIEGSTRLWEEHPDAMRAALAAHDRVLRDSIESAGGRVFKTIGDAFCAVFDAPDAALRAARDAQPALGAIQVSGRTLRVRMAVHAGEVEIRDDDCFGPPLNLVARLLAAGHGGQVLVSDTVAEAVGPVFECRLLGRHRLRDIARTIAIHQLLIPGLPRDHPPLRTLAERPAPGNLPAPSTSFVGREQALRDLAALSRAHRLVTIVGPGGGGKSRLLLQHGLEHRDRSTDGAWWVDLAGVEHPDDVPGAFARALEVGDDPGSSVIELVIRHLEPRDLLLLVDNCEHLTRTVAECVARILAACPKVHVVAASREALGGPGECRFEVPPLALPDPGRRATVDALAAHEATRLFLDRARLRVPDYAPSGDDTDAVVRICHRLDGIPLAIELAAARIGTLSASQIDSRLDRRFRLLVGADPSASPRRQTLRSMIDWSHDQLEVETRLVFHRLAVFPGGWDIDAAEAIAAGDGIDEETVLDHVGALVDKSLVATTRGPEGVRHRLLETLRAYATEKLELNSDAPAVRDRHARHYAERARRAARTLGSAAAKAELAHLDRERENLDAALEHLPGTAAARLCEDLEEVWHRLGRWREAVERIGSVVERVADVRERGRLLGIRGWFSHLRGDRIAAGADTDAALAAARATDDRIGEAAARNTAAFLSWSSGDTATARAEFEASLVLLEAEGEVGRAAGRWANLGLLEAETGDLERATGLLERAKAAYTTAGDLQGMGACLCNLADVALRTGDPETADARAAESTGLFDRLHDVPGVVYSLANRAEAALLADHPERALGHVDDALRRVEDPGMHSVLPMLLDLRVRALAGTNAMVDARRWRARCDRLRTTLEMPRDEEAAAVLRDAMGALDPGTTDDTEEGIDVEDWLDEIQGGR